MNPNSRTCFALRTLWAVLSIAALTGVATAQDTYPSKPVTIVVGQSPGGPADLLIRSLSGQLSQSLKQPVVVLNRDGAAGTIAVEAVKRAAPDGYTLGFGTQGPFTVQPHLRKVMLYSADDFEFVCQTNNFVTVVAVSLNSRYQTLRELVDAARKAPGTITLGSVGIGSGPHILGEGIALDAGVKFNHIPFRSPVELNAQIIGGTIDFTVTTPRSDLRPLAAVGGARLGILPDVPSLKELGYKRGQVPGFTGIFASKGVPATALALVRQACAAAVNSETFKTVSERIVAPRQYADSTEYTENIKLDMRSMTEILGAMGVKPE